MGTNIYSASNSPSIHSALNKREPVTHLQADIWVPFSHNTILVDHYTFPCVTDYLMTCIFFMRIWALERHEPGLFVHSFCLPCPAGNLAQWLARHLYLFTRLPIVKGNASPCTRRCGLSPIKVHYALNQGWPNCN